MTPKSLLQPTRKKRFSNQKQNQVFLKSALKHTQTMRLSKIRPKSHVQGLNELLWQKICASNFESQLKIEKSLEFGAFNI